MTIEDQVTIRSYKNQDKGSVLDLLRLNTPRFFSPHEEADFVYYLENEIQYYYVIEVNQQIVGSGGFNFSGDPTKGKISWDILHPNYQGKLLGSTLLKYRIEKLKNLREV